MPPALPIAVSDILAAVREPRCNQCGGLGRWRTKLKCPTCNGSGTTAEITEICVACNARGQVPGATGEPLDCALCNRFGVVFRDCWECARRGFVEKGDDYCVKCKGTGETPLALLIAETAQPQYVRHLIRCISENAQAGGNRLAAAIELDRLLHATLKEAYRLRPARDDELFSPDARLAFGDARLQLGQAVRRREEQERSEAAAGRAELLAMISELRSRAIEMSDQTERQYWSGLGYGWDL